MFCDKSETMKTSRLPLVVLTVGLLCVGNAVGQDEKKAESDAALLFEDMLAKAENGDAVARGLLGYKYFSGKGVIQDLKNPPSGGESRRRWEMRRR